MYSHYENFIELKTNCQNNMAFHSELSKGESADIAKIQAGIDYYAIGYNKYLDNCLCDIYLRRLDYNFFERHF